MSARARAWSEARTRPGQRFFEWTEPGRQMKGNFSNGPAIERWFFQLAGPDRKMKGDFSNGPGWAGKKKMSSGRARSGPEKSACADL